MRKITAKAGDVLIGGGNPIVVQTMCNTHTSDIEGTVAQCIRMKEAGARMIRITVPGPADVANIAEIRPLVSFTPPPVPVTREGEDEDQSSENEKEADEPDKADDSKETNDTEEADESGMISAPASDDSE